MVYFFAIWLKKFSCPCGAKISKNRWEWHLFILEAIPKTTGFPQNSLLTTWFYMWGSAVIKCPCPVVKLYDMSVIVIKVKYVHFFSDSLNSASRNLAHFENMTNKYKNFYKILYKSDIFNRSPESCLFGKWNLLSGVIYIFF